MVRVITQSTYDEVVKENMDEFDMSPEEAIEDAVAQFEAQGVNLSHIIKDLALCDGDDHLVTTTIAKLKDLAANNANDDLILKELDILKAECNKDIAHRVRAGKDGAYKILIHLLEAKLNKYLKETNEADGKFIINVLKTLVVLFDTQPDLLDDKGTDLIKDILDKVHNENIQLETLRWASRCCLKHEMNRQKLFAKNISDNLKLLLRTKNVKLLGESLRVIRRLTLDDDIRFEFGKAHEHAKELGVQMLKPLTELLKENTKPPIASDLMLTMASLLVRHELCKMVADSGSDVLFTVLADNYANLAVVTQANKLITALAGNDDVKRELVRSGIVPIILSIMTMHASDAKAAALTLRCVAALTLREPEHSRLVLEGGAPEVIVECLKNHPDDPSVQRNACLAVRNMVARCREHNAKFQELGIEPLLNEAFKKYEKDFGFDIKSALRDLECEVKLDEQWTGKGVQMGNDLPETVQ